MLHPRLTMMDKNELNETSVAISCLIATDVHSIIQQKFQLDILGLSVFLALLDF